MCIERHASTPAPELLPPEPLELPLDDPELLPLLDPLEPPLEDPELLPLEDPLELPPVDPLALEPLVLPLDVLPLPLDDDPPVDPLPPDVLPLDEPVIAEPLPPQPRAQASARQLAIAERWRAAHSLRATGRSCHMMSPKESCRGRQTAHAA